MELTSKDLMRFYCCSENTAIQRRKEILRFFGLPVSKNRIHILHLSKYEGLSVSDIRVILFE